MDVEDALEEYVNMLTAGSQALQRLAKRELDQPHAAELCELIEGILDHAASLKAAVGRTPTA